MLRLALFALACIAATAGTGVRAENAEPCDAAAIYKSCVAGKRPNCEQLLQEQQARCDERAAEAARVRKEAEDRAARKEAEDNAAKAEAEERDRNREWINQLPSASSRNEEHRKMLPSKPSPPPMKLPTRKKGGIKAGELR